MSDSIFGVIPPMTTPFDKNGDIEFAALQNDVDYLFKPHDDALFNHFATLADNTSIPIIIYNVVPWVYLSPQLLKRIITEVPGVIGVKQSAGDLKTLADLMMLFGDKGNL